MQYPRIGVEFQTVAVAQTSNNVFDNVEIQANWGTYITTNGFKNVDYSGNIFINCVCWDFNQATGSESAVEMNIVPNADTTTIIGGVIGENGPPIDQGFNTTVIAHGHLTLAGGPVIPSRFQSSPDSLKWGGYFGSATTNADGLLNGRLTESLVGTGASSPGGT
jgi:hypothetical protein